jgi:homeobox-leucine zipper protein
MYDQVTWVEHVEVDDRSVHNIYKLLVNSGLAFGARRWVGTLDRQCERLASVMASNIPTSDIGGKLFVVCTMHCSVSYIQILIYLSN